MQRENTQNPNINFVKIGKIKKRYRIDEVAFWKRISRKNLRRIGGSLQYQSKIQFVVFSVRDEQDF